MVASKNGTEAAKDSIGKDNDCLYKLYNAEAPGHEPGLPETNYEWMNGKPGGAAKHPGAAHELFVGHAT